MTGRRIAATLAVLVAVFAAALTAALIPSSPTALPGATRSPLPPSTAPASPPGDPAPPSPPRSATPGSSPSPAPPSARTVAERQLAALSLEQRVGQIFMVRTAATGADAVTLSALRDRQVGNVFLAGRSWNGTEATAAVVDQVRKAAAGNGAAGVPVFVATDQEGGNVQVLNGPGFSPMPNALAQSSLGPNGLQAKAGTWARELASTGINVNFAPVLDTVPSPASAPGNAPIGHFMRHYGYSPQTVAASGLAFAQGMKDAGVAPVAKHFPGLGRVVGNTDTTTSVTDTQTTRNDPALEPFRRAVDSGVRWVMLSNALYPNIDPVNIGPFSSTLIKGMLRGDLGFTGIVVSDDMCDARQLSPWPAGERATRFIAAGGTLALCTNQSLLAPMYDGVLTRARSDPAFRAAVDQAALKVLEVKAGA